MGAIGYGKRNDPVIILEDRGKTLVIQVGDRKGTVDRSKIDRWQYGGFYLGDRVTLADKYHVRAADVGTVEAISDKGIRILWDNKVANWAGLKQPPALHRTFEANELKLIDSKYLQN
jgi:hypothetical protein